MITIEMKFYDFSPNSRNVCVLCDYVFFNGISCLVVELLEIPRLPTILAIFVAFVIWFICLYCSLSLSLLLFLLTNYWFDWPDENICGYLPKYTMVL